MKFFQMQAAFVKGLGLKSLSANDAWLSLTLNYFASSLCSLPPTEFAFAARCNCIVSPQTAVRVSKMAPFVSRLCRPRGFSDICFGVGSLPRGQRPGSLKPPNDGGRSSSVCVRIQGKMCHLNLLSLHFDFFQGFTLS